MVIYNKVILYIFINLIGGIIMKKLFKCTICGFISEGEEAPEKCPKCNFPKENLLS